MKKYVAALCSVCILGATTLTVNAYTCNRLLNKRAIIQKNTITNIESGVRSVIENNLRELPNVELGELNGFVEEMSGGQKTIRAYKLSRR